MVENTNEKGEIAHALRAISRFIPVFSKDLYCRHVKSRACLGKGSYAFGDFTLIQLLSTQLIALVDIADHIPTNK